METLTKTGVHEGLTLLLADPTLSCSSTPVPPLPRSSTHKAAHNLYTSRGSDALSDLLGQQALCAAHTYMQVKRSHTENKIHKYL